MDQEQLQQSLNFIIKNDAHIHKIDAQYKVTIIEFLIDQRTLIKQQSRNANISLFSTIVMALATVGMFIIGYLQYDNSKKVEDVYQKLQVPELRAK